MAKQVKVEPVITDGRKVTNVENFQGKNYTIVLHMKHYQYPDYDFELVGKVTNEAGVELRGVWFWGVQGNNHIEHLDFESRKDSPNYLKMCTSGHWCNGRVKNGRKTLVAIIEKKD